MALNTFDIARCFAAAFLKDRALADWFSTSYGKNFSIQIGADMRALPNQHDAPFIAILPTGFDTSLQNMSANHVLRVIPGIADKERETVNGVFEYRGMRRLARELVPMLEGLMRDAVGAVTLQEVSVEYVILEFPLMEAFIDVSVKDSQPVGRRL